MTPVFDAETEEPQPRRRGRFGLRAAAQEEVDTIAPLVPHIDEKPIESFPEGLAPLEPAMEHDLPTDDEPMPKLESIPEIDDLETPTDASAKQDHPIPEQNAASAPADSDTSVSPDTPNVLWANDLSAIRRSATLLAIMSVIAVIVLIAILLAQLGIIPKK